MNLGTCRHVACLACFALPAATGTLSGDLSWLAWLQGHLDAPAGELETLGEVTATLPVAVAVAPPDKWAPITQLLQGWEFTENYAISVGTSAGQLYRYEGGSFTMKKKIPTGSTSKWPAAMMFAGLVADGSVASFDDPVSKYLTWWTKDPADLRSLVTFRMLLSFTSGFGGGNPGQEMNTRAARQWRLDNSAVRLNGTLEEQLVAAHAEAAILECNSPLCDVTKCARSVYDNVKLSGVPGKVFSYNSFHFQIAAAVALAATGLPNIQAVIEKYLLDPYGMASSAYSGRCPDFAVALTTTGEDYERFLQGVLGYKVLPKAVVDASEEDSTPFLANNYTLYGDYGFGHFLFCFDSAAGMTDVCRSERTHVDPGAFGFIPMIDRKRDYYFQVVAAEIPPEGSYPLSGIPEYLAVALKPHIDAIMIDPKDSPSQHLTHSPGLLSLAISDVNYCLKCKLHPLQCII